MIPEMIICTPIICQRPVDHACLSLDLDLMATVPSAIEEHIQTQIQIDAEVIETAVTQHIDKTIDSSATLCIASYAIQPSLTEFQTHELVINTGT